MSNYTHVATMPSFMLRKLVSGVARSLHPIIKPFEKHVIAKYGSAESCKYPVFIVGSPRSGSTILYQMVTYSIDCIYIDNFICPWHHTIYAGFYLSDIVFREKSHANFSSRYGNTSSWTSPSECQGLWYNWFPKDHDHVDLEDIDSNTITSLKITVTALLNRYKRNLVIKNLSCGHRIRVLSKVFPNAKFINIKRDPFFTVQSLLLARRSLSIADDGWWSVKPKNYEDLINLPLVEKLVAQVYFNECQIEEDLRGLQESNVYSVNYECYQEQFDGVLEFVGSAVNSEVDISGLSFTNKIKLTSIECHELRKAINKYDWKLAGYDG